MIFHFLIQGIQQGASSYKELSIKNEVKLYWTISQYAISPGTNIKTKTQKFITNWLDLLRVFQLETKISCRQISFFCNTSCRGAGKTIGSGVKSKIKTHGIDNLKCRWVVGWATIRSKRQFVTRHWNVEYVCSAALTFRTRGVL